MRGVTLCHVQLLLGHSFISVTERYAHLAPDSLAEAVARLIEPRTQDPGHPVGNVFAPPGMHPFQLLPNEAQQSKEVA